MRLTFVIAICIMVTSAISGMEMADVNGANGFFGGGDGTAANPYVIEDVWDLQNMSSNLSACYILKNDIDASATINWNSGAGFMPVGNDSNMFNGSLDGKNHTITGLSINRSTTYYVGLFGCVNKGGLLNDIILSNCNIIGFYCVGGLAGRNSGPINHSSFSGNVSGNGNYVGGLVGYNDGPMVNNSYVIGNVSGNCSFMGGVVGYLYNGTVNNAHTTNNVTCRIPI